MLIFAFSGMSMKADIYGVLLAITSGVLMSGGAYLLWYSLLPKLSPTTASTLQLSVPCLAAFGGLVFMGEALDGRMLLAIVITLSDRIGDCCRPTSIAHAIAFHRWASSLPPTTRAGATCRQSMHAFHYPGARGHHRLADAFIAHYRWNCRHILPSAMPENESVKIPNRTRPQSGCAASPVHWP